MTVAERKNRTLVEMARCMRIQSGLPESFWADAVSTANFTRNRCVTKSLKKNTPHELWNGKVPDLKKFRTFGEDGHYLDKSPARGKMDLTGIKCKFIGYDEFIKGYRVWVPSLQKIVTSRDFRFLSEDGNGGKIHKSLPQDDREPQDDLHDGFVEHHFYAEPKVAAPPKTVDRESSSECGDDPATTTPKVILKKNRRIRQTTIQMEPVALHHWKPRLAEVVEDRGSLGRALEVGPKRSTSSRIPSGKTLPKSTESPAASMKTALSVYALKNERTYQR